MALTNHFVATFLFLFFFLLYINKFIALTAQIMLYLIYSCSLSQLNIKYKFFFVRLMTSGILCKKKMKTDANKKKKKIKEASIYQNKAQLYDKITEEIAFPFYLIVTYNALLFYINYH